MKDGCTGALFMSIHFIIIALLRKLYEYSFYDQSITEITIIGQMCLLLTLFQMLLFPQFLLRIPQFPLLPAHQFPLLFLLLPHLRHLPEMHRGPCGI